MFPVGYLFFERRQTVNTYTNNKSKGVMDRIRESESDSKWMRNALLSKESG